MQQIAYQGQLWIGLLVAGLFVVLTTISLHLADRGDEHGHHVGVVGVRNLRTGPAKPRATSR